MNQKLVRIQSIDKIELPGILYYPKTKTNKIIIHVHGINGNFYENHFLDTLATLYTKKGYAFLTFNNRGRGFVSDLMKNKERIILGACYEQFKDCLLDLDGVISWANKNNYNEIILQGHSYGCNKVSYYYTKRKNENIKSLILLSPCDMPNLAKKFLEKNEYDEAKKQSTKLTQENKEDSLIPFSFFATNYISAKTFYYDLLPNGENDFFRYREKSTKSKILNEISIPVLAIFGETDSYVLTEDIDIVKEYLKENIKIGDVKIIPGADHSFTDKEQTLKNVIKDYL